DQNLYEASLETFQELWPRREAVLTWLSEIRSALGVLKADLLNPELASLEGVRERHHKETAGPVEYLDALSAAAASVNISLNNYPQLESLNKLKTLEPAEASAEAAGIDAGALLDEQARLEEAVFRALSRTRDEELLITYSRSVESLTHLFEQKLTPEELSRIRQRTLDFNLKAITGFLNRKIGELGKHHAQALFLEPGYEEALRDALTFYDLTLQRDQAFLEAMLRKMREENETQSVLVTGGYHTPNLMTLLKSLGISYTSVMPRVTHETDHARYERILLSQSGRDEAAPQLARKTPKHIDEAADAMMARQLQTGRLIDPAQQEPELLIFVRDFVSQIKNAPYSLTQEALGRIPTQQIAASRLSGEYFLAEADAGKSKEQLDQIVLDGMVDIATAVRQGVQAYVDIENSKGSGISEKVITETVQSVVRWLSSPHIDVYTKRGILKAVAQRRWRHILDAHSQKVAFGTAGPRAPAAYTPEELAELRDKGFRAEILKGPNTVNNVTLALLTTGAARRYQAAIKDRRPQVTVTWDTRTFGYGFADYVAAIFLKNDFDVSMFNTSSPMPEMSYATARLKQDLGILISASHNPEKFNGYKVSTFDGAQLDPSTRTSVERYIYGGEENGRKIPAVTFADIADVLAASAELPPPAAAGETPQQTGPDGLGPLVEKFSEANPQRVVVLESHDISGAPGQGRKHVDIHNNHARHVVSHVMDLAMVRRVAAKIGILYSPFYGCGREAFMRVMQRLGVPAQRVRVVSAFSEPDSMFTLFSTHKDAEGRKDSLIPDPGNSAGNARPWEVTIDQYLRQTRSAGMDDTEALDIDVTMGTDPDADRLGIGTPISPEHLPPTQKERETQLVFHAPNANVTAPPGYGGLRLLSANDNWTVIMKYRIDRLIDRLKSGDVPAGLQYTLIKTHVTTDALASLEQYVRNRNTSMELETIEPYVGFSLVAEEVKKGWRLGKINLGGCEESGGFSIGGGPTAFYAILRMFQIHNDYKLNTDNGRIVPSQQDPLMSLKQNSLFGYEAGEIKATLEYLAEHGVLRLTPAGYVMEERFLALRGKENHDRYWESLEPLAADAPCDRLGTGGHTLEKDGLMAAALTLEVLAYAREVEGLDLNGYLRKHVYMNPDIGYFATTNQSKKFETGEAGNAAKISALRSVLEMVQRCKRGEKIRFNDTDVENVTIFIPEQQKYADAANFPVEAFADLEDYLALGTQLRDLQSWFPEEGIRFYLEGGMSYLTIRPSGTEPKIRFYVQTKAGASATDAELTTHMLAADKEALQIAEDAIRQVEAGAAGSRVSAPSATAADTAASRLPSAPISDLPIFEEITQAGLDSVLPSPEQKPFLMQLAAATIYENPIALNQTRQFACAWEVGDDRVSLSVVEARKDGRDLVLAIAGKEMGRFNAADALDLRIASKEDGAQTPADVMIEALAARSDSLKDVNEVNQGIHAVEAHYIVPLEDILAIEDSEIASMQLELRLADARQSRQQPWGALGFFHLNPKQVQKLRALKNGQIDAALDAFLALGYVYGELPSRNEMAVNIYVQGMGSKMESAADFAIRAANPKDIPDFLRAIGFAHAYVASVTNGEGTPEAFEASNPENISDKVFKAINRRSSGHLTKADLYAKVNEDKDWTPREALQLLVRVDVGRMVNVIRNMLFAVSVSA
ncbi:MAG: hypothetical protein HQL11_03490, partial [Candidatus Omnitrophica bacterium]|nr:hypothetical protein [Candidatus Omnitrophota bacterium]